jgi:hypothetical protein
MALSGDGTPTGKGPHGSSTALWSLVLGLVTAASIVGLSVGLSVRSDGAPRSVVLVLFTVAITCGLGSMILGVVSFLPRRNISGRARRQAFAGAALGSLVLVGIGFSVASALVLTSQANPALAQIAAQLQKTVQAQQRCVSAAQSAGASPQAASDECAGSSTACRSTTPTESGFVVCANGTFYGNTTTDPWGAALALLVWAGLVFAAGWLVFGSRGPPPLAGATP